MLIITSGKLGVFFFFAEIERGSAEIIYKVVEMLNIELLEVKIIFERIPYYS